MITQEHALSRLEWSIRALAQSASVQRTLFPSFVDLADELALELEESLDLMERAGVVLPSERAEALARLDGQIMAMSGLVNERFWTEEALDSAPEWTSIRAAASDVIRAFAWSNEPPSGSPQIYVTEGQVVRVSDAE